MRLERIELVNWRSIPACNIDLSASTTVIIGQNTTGKTALLNAFVWGLYEQTTPGFSKPDDLCNHQAKLELNEGEKTKTEVEVTFRHGVGEAERRYVARRTLTVTRTGPGIDDFQEDEPQFLLTIHPLGPVGDTEQARGEAAQRKVQAIIPASLNPYFFFPAENIGASIGSPDARAASVKDAVSVLLGLRRYEVADAAIKEALRLPKLKEKASSDLDIRKAQEGRDLAREQHEEAVAQLSQLNDQKQRVELLQEEAEKAVKRVQSAKELIEERSGIDESYKQAQQKAGSARDHRRRLLNAECFNLFGTAPLLKARRVLDMAKSDDRIPPKVSAGLLDDLIDGSKTCICGQPINDSARSTLRELRRGVVDDIVAESASNVLARVSDRSDQLLARTEEEAPHAALRAANKSISDADRDVATWRSKRDEFDMENPVAAGDADSNPTAAFLKHTRTLIQLKEDQNELRDNVEELSQKKREADAECGKLQRKRGKADQVSKARGHLTHIEQAVEDIQKVLSDGSRNDLERAINKIASQVLLRDYTIHLTENFDIEARQNGIEIGGSSSDHSWVTFAFVGAISGLIGTYDRKLDSMDDAGSIELEPGAGYPLVLDAPFSPFGETYATEFAERLPDLAPQSVLIVREDQLAHLETILGAGPDKTRAYLMCLHGPPTADKQEIQWRDGSNRAYVRPSDSWDDVRTTLEELPL